MQELVDMLRNMAGACKAISAGHPVAHAQAVQYVARGSIPGIRAGLANGLMIRIAIEKENNVDNAQANDNVSPWNTLWADPEHDGMPM